MLLSLWIPHGSARSRGCTRWLRTELLKYMELSLEAEIRDGALLPGEVTREANVRDVIQRAMLLLPDQVTPDGLLMFVGHTDGGWVERVEVPATPVLTSLYLLHTRFIEHDDVI